MVVPEEGMAQAANSSMIPSKLPSRIDPDVAFSVCVQFRQYTAKLDDGTCVHVPRKYEEWAVDYTQCTLESLEKDFAARIKWGSGQYVVVSRYDMSIGVGTKFVDNTDLMHAFSVGKKERSLFLFVAVVDKPHLLVNSCVSEDNEVVMGDVVAARQDSNRQLVIDWDSLIAPIAQQQVPQHVVDWDTFEVAPILEDQIGLSLPLKEEDEMSASVGIRDEDERAEQARIASEKARVEGEKQWVGPAPPPTQDDNAEIVINDVVPGEAEFFYDREDPPMKVGSTYPTMVEFRSAVRQHAIKGKFELGTEKSDKERFRGHCTAEGCPWAIVARLMRDGKSVRVTVNKFAHTCASTGRIKTKMASYHWVAKKAIPFLKKDPDMGAKKLKDELESKYNVTIGYGTVWSGRQKAADQIFGKREESFVDGGQGSSKQMTTRTARKITQKKRKKMSAARLYSQI